PLVIMKGVNAGLIGMVLLPTTRYELPLARLTTVPSIVAAGPPAVSIVPSTTIGELGATVIGTFPGPSATVKGVKVGLIGTVLPPTTRYELPLARLTTVPSIVAAGPPAVSIVPSTTIGELGATVIGTFPGPSATVKGVKVGLIGTVLP